MSRAIFLVKWQYKKRKNKKNIIIATKELRNIEFHFCIPSLSLDLAAGKNLFFAI